jgi:hypothetical protein
MKQNNLMNNSGYEKSIAGSSSRGNLRNYESESLSGYDQTSHSG